MTRYMIETQAAQGGMRKRGIDTMRFIDHDAIPMHWKQDKCVRAHKYPTEKHGPLTKCALSLQRHRCRTKLIKRL
jgi:hypothetical protein